MQGRALLFFRPGDAFEHEHEGAAGAAYIDGLVGGVEHQHGGLHGLVERQGAVFRRNGRAVVAAGVVAGDIFDEQLAFA